MQKEKNKNEEVKDYEKMYYQVMRENILLRDKVIAIDLTADEITYLKELVFFELNELSNKRPYSAVDDDEAAENAKLNRVKKDELYTTVLDEKTRIMESVMLKLKLIK